MARCSADKQPLQDCNASRELPQVICTCDRGAPRSSDSLGHATCASEKSSVAMLLENWEGYLLAVPEASTSAAVVTTSFEPTVLSGAFDSSHRNRVLPNPAPLSSSSAVQLSF